MLNLLLSMSSHAVLVFDENGNVLRANRNASERLGYSPTELTQQTWKTIFPAHHTALREKFPRSHQLVDQIEALIPIKARCKDGSEWLAVAQFAGARSEDENVFLASLQDAPAGKTDTVASDEILNTVGNLVLVANSHADIIYASPSSLNILGYHPREILGEGWWQIERRSGREVNAEKEYIRQLARGDLPAEGKPDEHRMRHRDGSWRWLMLTQTKGPRDLVIGVGTDITDLIQAGEELQSQHDFAQTLTSQMGQGLTVTDETGRFTFVNPSYAHMLGYVPSALLGKTPFDVTFPEDHAALQDAHLRRMKGEATSYESRLRRSDGQEVFAFVTGVPRMLNGQFVGAITVVTDLTERRRMENALRENEGFIQELYEITSSQADFPSKVQALLRLGVRRFHLPLGIFSSIKGEQYLINSVEPADGSINAGDVFNLRDTYCQETIKSRQPLSFNKAQGTPWEQHPCYQSFQLEAYLGVVVFVSGRVHGTLNFSSRAPLEREITEADKSFIQLMSLWIGEEIGRLQAKQQILSYTEEIQKNNIQLAEARDRALEASYLKSAFLATISHEIRTPMNAILGMTEMLLDTELTLKQREYAEVIDSSTHNLLGILNDILDFSKIEAGKLSIRPTSFKPHELVRETMRLFQSKAQEKNISLSMMVTQVIPEILVGDAGRIRQVLNNLVSNAVKFTERNGVIFINVSGTQIGGDKVMTTFTVQDNGSGIPLAVQEQLFEPFTQADTSNTRRHGGTGLGLAISKRLVELMHGEIGFETREGSGSTFWVSLPLDTNLLAHASRAAQPKYGNYAGRKPVLVVEDNFVSRDLFAMQLREFGLNTRHAGNGMEAVELLQTEPDAFSLIIMDLNMPIMEGFTATHLIRELEVGTGRHIPIIAISATAMQGSRELCLNAGMDDFLSKPVSLSDFDALFAKWLA